MAIPENILSIHSHEESIRESTIEAIEKEWYLLLDLSLIEKSMNLITHFILQHENDEDGEKDILTIQRLGIRIFNGSASALKLLLSGYYQTSALQQRDILETIFLIDYLKTDKSQISKWSESDEKARRKNYGPGKIRDALDARDGHTDKKRNNAYKLLCNLAGHPTNDGFRMLTPEQGGDSHCGPYFGFNNMRATLEELAKEMIQAGSIFTLFFQVKTELDLATCKDFLNTGEEWREKLKKRPPVKQY
jgi:hypothetical protein